MTIRSRTLPPPPPACLEQIDAALAEVLRGGEERAEWVAEYGRNHRQRLAADLAMVKERVSTTAIILEAGAFPPVLTAALKMNGYRVVALDLDPERCRRTSESLALDLRACNIETEAFPLADGEVEVVLFNEVFEHLRINLLHTFREVMRVCKPGASLFLSTPNVRSLQGMLNYLFAGKCEALASDVFQEYRKLETLGHMGHVREYSPVELSRFLEQVGFQPQEILFRGGDHQTKKRILYQMLPSLRPFFSIVAQKPLNP